MAPFHTTDITPSVTTTVASSSYNINSHICPICHHKPSQKSTTTHDATTAIPTLRLKASMPASPRARRSPRKRSLPRPSTRSLLSPASVGRYNVAVSTGTATRAYHTSVQQQARALPATRPAGKENLEPASTAVDVEKVAEERKTSRKLEARAKKPRTRLGSGEEKQKGKDDGKNAKEIIRNEKINALDAAIDNTNSNNNPQPGQHQPGCWECELTRRHLFELWGAAGHGSVLEREQEKLNHARRRV